MKCPVEETHGQRQTKRKVSVISTHMRVSGTEGGFFNKGIQMCLVVFVSVIWMCLCAGLQIGSD